MTTTNRKKLLLAAMLIALVPIGYFAVKYNLIVQMISLVDKNTPTPLFIALMIILPIFGAPISIFLIVLGIKFGLAPGLALMVFVMPIHMIASYVLTKIARNLIQAILLRGSYVIPQVPADRQVRFSFLVAALPVLPYPVKNCFLPLAGIPFKIYLALNWPCQAVLAVPAVVLGRSIHEVVDKGSKATWTDLDPVALGAAVAGYITIYLIISRIEKKYGKQVDFKEEKQN